MPAPKLSVGDVGDDVALLHENLTRSGFSVSPEEVKRKFFGPSTRAAVTDLQNAASVEVTGHVDDVTHAVLRIPSLSPPTVASGIVAGIESTIPTVRIPPVAAPSLTSNVGESTVPSAGLQHDVEGQIVLEHGLPLANMTVRLYHVGFGGKRTLIGEAGTTDQGNYKLPVLSTSASSLEVHAVDASGREVQLSSATGLSVGDRLDLIAPSKLQPAAPEFSRLAAAITPHSDGNLEFLKQAVERGGRKDFTFLANETGWDPAAVAIAADAVTLESHTKIPAEGLYAMARSGLPLDLRKLANVSSAVVSRTVRQAAQAGIMDAASVDAVLQAHKSFAADFRFNNSLIGAVSAPKDFVSKARVSEADRTTFAKVVREGSTEDIWKSAREAGVTEDGIGKLQLQGKLAYLTFNNAPLAEFLETKISSNVLELIELGYYDEAPWRDAFRQISAGDDTRQAALIPSLFRGADLETRSNAYAAELARRVRQMDTHAVTVDRIAKGKIDGVADRESTSQFLRNASAQGFRLGRTPLTKFVNDNQNSVWAGIAPERQTTVLENVKVLSSLYSVSPSDETMSALLSAGFKSATSIARLNQGEFHNRISRFLPAPKPGDTETTKALYWKAQQQSATVFNVFNGLKRLNSSSHMPGANAEDRQAHEGRVLVAKKKLSGLFPTLENLFGSVDYCECEQCQSVLSPAAYLVDILHFLDPDDETWSTVKGNFEHINGVPYTKRKPFDVLNDRRPDIKNIALTCENTNVALPYIDIVNEVLEQLMMSDQTPPAINAYDVGDSTSPDLLAEPQNTLWSAYIGGGGKKGLRDLVYPITLPFDLPLEMVRAFLKQLQLPLWRLRECVVRPSALLPSASGRADSWTDVWMERLGLSPSEISALSASDQWWRLYGYDSQSDALQPEALRNGKTLARRLDVTYQELVDMVRTRFVNPHIENLIVLKNLGVDPSVLDRYFGESPALSAAEKSELEAGLRAQGVQPSDLQPLRSAAVRAQTIILRSPAVGCDFSTTSVAFDQNPTDEPAALSLVLLKLNVFVRLQRKLGWDMQELDRALMALTPGLSSLSMADWPAVIRTTLIYFAHLEELRERFQGRLTREEICLFWSDIPTTGFSSLYQRLFLSPAVLARDSAFQKRFGRTLEATEPLATHVDGIRQALQVAQEDLESILVAAAAPDRLLNISNLSILARYSLLAKGLDITIADLLALLSLSARAPLSALDPAPLTDLAKNVPWSQTIAFLREVDWMRDAGVDPAFMDRICRHRGVPEEASVETDPLLIAVLALAQAGEANDPKQQILRTQTLAAQLSVPEALIDLLLSQVLKDATGKSLNESGFADRAQTLESVRRLRKALDLIQSLEFTSGELAFILQDSNALNPNNLPVAEVTVPAQALAFRQGLTPWLQLAAVRRQFGQSERLLSVLSCARQPIDASHTLALRQKDLYEALAALIGPKTAWIAAALDAIGVKSINPAAFEVPSLASPEQVRLTVESLKCFIRIGLSPADVVQISGAAIDGTVARKVRSSVKGRYTPSAWRRLVKPIFDGLRAKQRDALVAHLTHVMDGDRPKYGDTKEKLFECLLLDPGTEPVVVASRIQLAISSVQFFVQRCLMNLESVGVDPRIIDRDRWLWMHRYRFWEVNRKMFIWPENLLDSEFRDDKTHLFRALEGKLLEGDVNDDLVRDALYSYVKGLELIGRLEMLTMYFEPGISADGSTIHVVGRTTNAPYKYFYRRNSHGMWTPWEPIDLGIDGNHLVLTSWRGRLHLFWVSFLSQAKKNEKLPENFDPAKTAVDLKSLPAPAMVQLQIHWVEYTNGKWGNRCSTEFEEASAFAGFSLASEPERQLFSVRAVVVGNGPGPEDDDLEIQIAAPARTTGHKYVFFSKLAPPRLESVRTEVHTPPFDGISPRATGWDGNEGLRATFVSSVTQNSQTGTVVNPDRIHSVLQGGGAFRLLFPSNETIPVPSRTPPAGVGRPAGLVFGPQNAQHVVYRAGDGSISDLFSTGTGWFYQTPSSDAIAADPALNLETAAGDPHIYGIDERGILCVPYHGATKIHELSWSQLDATMNDTERLSTGWRIETLYQGASAADAPVGRPFGGIFQPQRGVVFRTQDGKIKAAVESSNGVSWEILEINAGLARAISDPTGLLMTKTEQLVTTVLSRHIFYVGDDGDVHELRSVDGQTWNHSNITQAMPGVIKPKAGGSPCAYAFLGQNTLHVVYRGTDDCIQELWGFPGSWNHNPVGGPFTKAKGDPVGYVTEKLGIQHIVYRGGNDEVVELWWLGIWRENILTKTARDAQQTKSDVFGYSGEISNTQHVVYIASDGNPRELEWNTNGWHPRSYSLNNPFPDPLGPLAAPFFYQSRRKGHTFFVEPSVVETVAHEWTDWIVTTREFVDPYIDFGLLAALNPKAIAFAPSKVSKLQFTAPVSKNIFEKRAVIRSLRGDITSGRNAADSLSNVSPEFLVEPTAVASPQFGLTTALTRTLAMRTRGEFQ